MAIEVIVPDMGNDINEGTLSFWHKKEGEDVEKDEELVEIETDNNAICVYSPASGILSQILAEEGEVVSPGDVIAIIDEE